MSTSGSYIQVKNKLEKVLKMFDKLNYDYKIPEGWNGTELGWFLTDIIQKLEEKRATENDFQSFQKKYDNYVDKRDILFKELGLK